MEPGPGDGGGARDTWTARGGGDASTCSDPVTSGLVAPPSVLLLYIFSFLCPHCQHTRDVGGVMAAAAALLLKTRLCLLLISALLKKRVLIGGPSAPDLRHPINHLHDPHVSLCFWNLVLGSRVGLLSGGGAKRCCPQLELRCGTSQRGSTPLWVLVQHH